MFFYVYLYSYHINFEELDRQFAIFYSINMYVFATNRPTDQQG
nr:MAG TPA: hypothetical protein [Siphoviridae sp. ctqkP4]